MLQCRNGKRTGFAGVRIAVEMVDEKLIPKEEALRRVEPEALNQLLRPVFLPSAKKAAVAEGRLLAKGLPAGPGAATGKVVFFADEAEALAAKGETNLILCRHETSPEDIRGMNASLGFMTAFGGMTSHAALVARQMGKVCIVGCDALSFDYHARTMTVETAKGEVVVKEGDWISIDGFAGEVIQGRIETTPSEVIRVLIEKNLDAKEAPIYQTYAKLMSWADAARKLKVRANADQPDQADRVGGLRRRGDRPLPHGAHVLRRGEDRPHARDDRRRERGRPPQGARQAAAAAARGLPRPLQGDGGATGHHPDARSAAARVPAARRGGRGAIWRAPPARPSRRSTPASRSSRSRTRCSATAAAAWGSPTRRSPRCRRAPSSRRP